MTLRLNINESSLFRALALLSLLLPATADAGSLLPQPSRVSQHAWAWIGPYGPPTKENGGFRMNMGFVVGKDRVVVIDSGYSAEMASSMIEQIRGFAMRHFATASGRPLPGVFARAWPIGSTALWIAVLLIGYIVVYYF